MKIQMRSRATLVRSSWTAAMLIVAALTRADSDGGPRERGRRRPSSSLRRPSKHCGRFRPPSIRRSRDGQPRQPDYPARQVSSADLLDSSSVNPLPNDAAPDEEYDANGVDRTLIRACLRESPLECLQALEEMHQLAESVRGAWKTDSSG